MISTLPLLSAFLLLASTPTALDTLSGNVRRADIAQIGSLRARSFGAIPAAGGQQLNMRSESSRRSLGARQEAGSRTSRVVFQSTPISFTVAFFHFIPFLAVSRFTLQGTDMDDWANRKISWSGGEARCRTRCWSDISHWTGLLVPRYCWSDRRLHDSLGVRLLEASSLHR